MNNSALCIDVSKSSSYANGFVNFNKPYSKPISFDHTPDGLSSVSKYLLELEAASGSKPHVVLEATGNYSKLIAYAGIDPSVYQSGSFRAKNNKVVSYLSKYNASLFSYILYTLSQIS